MRAPSRAMFGRGPKRNAAITPLQEIALERRRQVEVEGWTAIHDDEHDRGELAIAAGWYALNAPFVGDPMCLGNPMIPMHEAHSLFTSDQAAMRWPWDTKWWKPKSPRRDLIRAAALIVAEIERLDRSTGQRKGGDDDNNA